MDRTPREYLTFVAKAKGISKAELKQQIEHAMSVTQITDVADRLIKNLSKGYKQRVGIAQALLGHPEVIILDEPTVGLDPKQIIEIRDLIQSLGKEHTVILSSHILSEVRAVCQTILIISKGKLVACDTPEHLEKRFTGSSTVELVVEATEEEARSSLSSIHKIKKATYQTLPPDQLKITLELDGKEDICKELFFAFCAIKRPILQMTTTTASLEDIFIELTSNNTQSSGTSHESHSINKEAN